MNKILTVILSFTILFQSFDFKINDFNELPTLFDHIVRHIETGDSFADFISLHYGSLANKHKSEHKEHQKLPFKHQNFESHFQLDYILQASNIEVNSSEIIIKKGEYTYKEPSVNLFANYFFQPPQK